MAVTTETPVQRIAQGLRFLFVAGIGGKINVEPGHLVETDEAIYGPAFEVPLHPVAEFRIAP